MYFSSYFLHELKENDYALCELKRKTEGWELKKIESIIAKIHDIIWEIQEVY